MDEEERQDTQLRERFKQKWTPKPSAELTAQLRDEAAKYRGILENAVRADSIVREKYNSHRRAMDVLCKGEVWIGVEYFQFIIMIINIEPYVVCTYFGRRETSKILILCGFCFVI